MTPSKHPRRKKIIRRSFQLKLIGSFVGLAAMALMLQFLLLGWRLGQLSPQLESPGQLTEEIPGLMLSALAFSFGILVPILFGFGVVLTHKIAGPLHRFEIYLKQVADGETSSPCTIRSGDELQGLCDAINQVTEPLREGRPAPTHAEVTAPAEVAAPAA